MPVPVLSPLAGRTLTGMRVAGVDGTRGGWVCVVAGGGPIERAVLIPTVETDFAELGDVSVIATDVPIGFGPRDADRAARGSLRGAAGTVFTVPSRAVLRERFRAGLGVSAQAHAIGPRILHVTALAHADARLHEVHPEVSFRAMNGGAALAYRKKSAGGALERLELLRRHGLDVAKFEGLGDAARVPLDDLLDAAAASWSAVRIADGSARSLPDPPQAKDGLRIAIWY
jgi:predicted RNase H-like nuclease